jgi:S1-C subfamily serine protease
MLSSEWLEAFVAVGALGSKNRWAAAGAGVLYFRAPFMWVITASHLIDDLSASRLSLLIGRTSSESPTVVELGKIQSAHGLGWIRDPEHDIAVALMPVSPEFHMKGVALENCLPLAEVLPSMPCYTIGCAFGIQGVDPRESTPLILDGIISGVHRSDQVLFTTAPTFPGNSGGPLVAIRSPFTPDGGMIVGRPTVLLAGIMLQTAVCADPREGGSLPPLHLGVAKSMDVALRLLESSDAREQEALASAEAPTAKT